MKENPKFNLVDEPWIQVRMHDGCISELSIWDIFKQSAEIKDLKNDNAAQDFAILRVLLAILQRALVPELDEDDDPAEEWGKLWNADDLPLDCINQYLNNWHHRFNLFDEETPFMQVAGLEGHTNKGVKRAWQIDKIIPDVPKGDRRFFTMQQVDSMYSISPAEAARWLIHAQAFDDGGVKDDVTGMKDGRSHPKGAAWAGKLGCVSVEGDNLKETLLLNLILWSDDSSILFSFKDKPIWEQEPCNENGSSRTPTGRLDLYTWQSRRICLKTFDGSVTRVVIGEGNNLKAEDCEQIEPMSSWSMPNNERLHLKCTPVRHDANKALWRGLPSILPIHNDGTMDTSTYVPGLISWLGHLMSDNGRRRLPETKTIRLRAVGYKYGDSETTYLQMIDDVLDINDDLLSPENYYLVTLVIKLIARTEQAVNQLGNLARSIYLAEGGASEQTVLTWGNKRQKLADTKSEAAKAKAFFELDGRFRVWLVQLNASCDISSKEREWNAEARNIISQLADEIICRSNAEAFVGREVKIKGCPIWMNASRAEAIFKSQLKKTLPITNAVDKQ